MSGYDHIPIDGSTVAEAFVNYNVDCFKLQVIITTATNGVDVILSVIIDNHVSDVNTIRTLPFTPIPSPATVGVVVRGKGQRSQSAPFDPFGRDSVLLVGHLID